MPKILILFLFIFFQLISLTAQVKKDVLFIGNSYTEVNNLPQLISYIAASKGDTLIFNSNTPGGYTLQLHTTNQTTLSKIKSNQWDYVVLQEQSQLPSFPPEQVKILVYPFADTLNHLIKINDTCTITTFFMTWGKKNGDSEYCHVYPPVCTFNGMQSRLRQSYLEMEQMFNSYVVPVGIVWKKIRDFHPEIELYDSDESHPSLAGSYVAACTFYASLFHKSPVDAFVPNGLDENYAKIIQNFSNQIVFDSLHIWNIDTAVVKAVFSFSLLQSGRVAFINRSRNATSFLWDFGDGYTSVETNPVHSYQYCDTTFIVSLTAYKNCETDLYKKEILIPYSGIDEISGNTLANIFPNPANNTINIEFKEALITINYNITIFDRLGKQVMSQNYCNNNRIISLPHLSDGIYIIQLNSNGKTVYSKIQIIQEN